MIGSAFATPKVIVPSLIIVEPVNVLAALKDKVESGIKFYTYIIFIERMHFI